MAKVRVEDPILRALVQRVIGAKVAQDNGNESIFKVSFKQAKEDLSAYILPRWRKGSESFLFVSQEALVEVRTTSGFPPEAISDIEISLLDVEFLD